jgi:hypothetical protein
MHAQMALGSALIARGSGGDGRDARDNSCGSAEMSSEAEELLMMAQESAKKMGLQQYFAMIREMVNQMV